jgi:hypothetical protein
MAFLQFIISAGILTPGVDVEIGFVMERYPLRRHGSPRLAQGCLHLPFRHK